MKNIALPDVEAAVSGAIMSIDALEDEVGTRVYLGVAPPGTARPYIVYYQYLGTLPNDRPRLEIRNWYTIDVAADTRGKAKEIASIIFQNFHKNVLLVEGWGNYLLFCRNATSMTEPADESGPNLFREMQDYEIRLSKADVVIEED